MKAKVKQKTREKIHKLSKKMGIKIPQSKEENALLARQAHVRVVE
jgi:hypothetical protein